MSKKSKKKIIAWLVSSTTLVGGATAGGVIAVNETESEPPAKKKNQSSIATKSNPETKKTKHLASIIPSNERHLGKLYINKNNDDIDDNHKIFREIDKILKNKYHINDDKLELNLNVKWRYVELTSINNDVYLGSVILNFSLDEPESKREKRLTIIIPEDKRHLGTFYFDEITNTIENNEKVEKEIKNVFVNKLNLNETLGTFQKSV